MTPTKKEFPKNLKIMLVATEAAPYASVGGAGSVVGHLSRSLVNLGHEVAVFIPKFGFIDEKKLKTTMAFRGLKVPTDDPGNAYLICNVKILEDEYGVTYYFLENQEYYEKRANVYGYSDDPTRFLLLSRGALEFIKTKTFVPDIIQCNDWHTGSLPNYLKKSYQNDPILSNIPVLFTIHNLAYQGMFDHKHVTELNYDDGRSAISSFFAPRVNNLNFMRRGILYADAVNTVSKTYSHEILTPEFGEGLDKLLLELKSKLFGIVNGIDYEEMDPEKDALLNTNYDINSLDLRLKNKLALQREFGLPVNEDMFVMGFVGRLDAMKGIGLAVDVLYHVLKEHTTVQFVQIGGGDWGIVEKLQGLKEAFPDKVGIHPYANFTLPRLLFGGADVILYPSKFEPCGIVQLEAMRYGSVPIVRNVGGLADTVDNFDSVKRTGTGFVFDEFDSFSLHTPIIRAIEIFKNQDLWKQLQLNAMKADFSWEHSAQEYVKLYERTHFLKGRVIPGKGLSSK